MQNLIPMICLLVRLLGAAADARAAVSFTNSTTAVAFYTNSSTIVFSSLFLYTNHTTSALQIITEPPPSINTSIAAQTASQTPMAVSMSSYSSIISISAAASQTTSSTAAISEPTGLAATSSSTYSATMPHDGNTSTVKVPYIVATSTVFYTPSSFVTITVTEFASTRTVDVWPVSFVVAERDKLPSSAHSEEDLHLP